MRNTMQFISRFGRDETGPTAVEYAVMIALVVIVCIAALAVLGQTASGVFTSAGAGASPSP